MRKESILQQVYRILSSFELDPIVAMEFELAVRELDEEWAVEDVRQIRADEVEALATIVTRVFAPRTGPTDNLDLEEEYGALCADLIREICADEDDEEPRAPDPRPRLLWELERLRLEVTLFLPQP